MSITCSKQTLYWWYQLSRFHRFFAWIYSFSITIGCIEHIHSIHIFVLFNTLLVSCESTICIVWCSRRYIRRCVPNFDKQFVYVKWMFRVFCIENNCFELLCAFYFSRLDKLHTMLHRRNEESIWKTICIRRGCSA